MARFRDTEEFKCVDPKGVLNPIWAQKAEETKPSPLLYLTSS